MPSRASSAPPALFGVDWGTSSLRFFAFDRSGEVVFEQRSDDGTLATARRAEREGRDAAFGAALAMAGHPLLIDHPDVPLVACGMVGSRDGLREVPYLAAPLSTGDIGANLFEVSVADRRVHIVPGVAQPASETRLPDVMRGEETQIAGVVRQVQDLPPLHTVVLPGTHTKWVRVNDGRLDDFSTSMSGELFAAVRDHSIVGRPAANDSTFDIAAFRYGFDTAMGDGGRGGLAANLFSARSLHLSGQLAAGAIGPYLSGVILADEIAHQWPRYAQPGGFVVIVGSPELAELYRWAIERAGGVATVLGDGATQHGIWQIACRAGLVEPIRDDDPVQTRSKGDT